jgi:diguanylate cyclase (GGDEF)-like protein
MNQSLETILSCPTLPSLPAIAVRVIELTSDVNVSLKELSRQIQNDQGLAARVLKTVNSSFYGLRQPCASIDKALVLLGLSPVKSLVLGFSLIASVKQGGESGFDFREYWRRGLYSAVASRLIAERAGFEFADEVFLGGLLQDVGMVAMHCALGAHYAEVVREAGPDHRELVAHELARFDLQHPDVGAMLVERWKLPQELVLPVRYHERPSAAPACCVDRVRCVGLGNMVHDVLTQRDSAGALRRLYARAKAWYRLEPGDVDEIVRAAGDAGRQMSGLFSLDIGPYANAEAVLAEAGALAVALAKSAPGASSVMSRAQDGSALAGSDFDPLTGAIGPRGFERAVREGFRRSVEHGEPVALVEAVIDGYAGLISKYGEGADLEAVTGVTALLKHVFEGHGGVVCRVGAEACAVVLPGIGSLTAVGLAESCVEDLERASWSAPSSGEPLRVTASVGVAALDDDTRAVLTDPSKLVLACARAMQTGRAAGGATLRVFQPRAAAA